MANELRLLKLLGHMATSGGASVTAEAMAQGGRRLLSLRVAGSEAPVLSFDKDGISKLRAAIDRFDASLSEDDGCGKTSVPGVGDQGD